MDRWTGRETRLLRHALRLTVRDFAEDLGVSPRTVSKWEAGGADHAPRPELQRALDTALSRATDEQRTRFETAVGTSDSPRSGIAPSGRTRPSLSSRCLALADVAQLRDEIRSLAAAYDVSPSVSLLATTASCQAEITEFRNHVSSGSVRQELLTADAEASTLMGQLVWDASQRRDHASARQYFEHAVDVARRIQDPVLEAHAVLRQSYVALYGQADPARGLVMADRAACLSRRWSPVLAGLALLHVAEARAMLGDRAACERALGDAEECFAAQSDLDVAADYYSPTQPSRLAGSCYLSLGLPDRAERLLYSTAQDITEAQKVTSLVLGNLSLAYLRQRQLEAAVASLHTALDELERTRGGAGLNVVFAAGRELRPWRSEPVVQEVQDRMLALVATT